MFRFRQGGWLLLVLTLAMIGLWWLDTSEGEVSEEMSVSQVLGSGQTDGFVQVMAPHPFCFPEDHGPHPDYKHEWWYVTGNLESTETKQRFGFQWTLFRIGLAPPGEEERLSKWAANGIHMGHLALTDEVGNQFIHFQRFGRLALGLAGAESGPPLKIWLEDWQLTSRGGPADIPDLHLKAQEQEMAIDLTMVAIKPVMLQGEAGFSQKGAKPGNASYYYSLPRLATTGTIQLEGQIHSVAGLSWLDREWSTSALEPEQSGWDWFSLQLNNGWDLMYYRMRRKDGENDPHSAGGWFDPQGQRTPIAASTFHITPLDHWISPKSGARYPSGWQLRELSSGLDLTVTPLLKDQELDGAAVRYWEGAVYFSGKHLGKAVDGRGYVELVGY
ncbi:MAG: carotenoid 1,2-hydratase [Magnetococcales bacterium]|nr:carotenoid 1,2-hydratase [Magnetococcales bacterium]